MGKILKGEGEYPSAYFPYHNCDYLLVLLSTLRCRVALHVTTVDMNDHTIKQFLTDKDRPVKVSFISRNKTPIA